MSMAASSDNRPVTGHRSTRGQCWHAVVGYRAPRRLLLIREIAPNLTYLLTGRANAANPCSSCGISPVAR
jgi:hypothetical protein